VVADRRRDLLAAGRDRQLLGVRDGRDDDGVAGLGATGRVATESAAVGPAALVPGFRPALRSGVGCRRADAPSTPASTGRTGRVGRRRLLLARGAHD
jgi:hypothetical protein